MATQYFVNSKKSDLDIHCIHQFLSQSYWAKGISLELVKKSIEGSLCFGIYTADKQQVGFARMITDKATFAYLADVFVVEQHRQQGLAKKLMQHILQHEELQGLRRLVLATRDAHTLYQQFDFKPLASPDIFMELHQGKIYQQ